MKVGIDIREVRKGDVTGIGRYTMNILEYLASHPSGHRYYLYTDRDVPESVSSPAFYERRRHAPTRFWFDTVTLGRAARADGLDVFFSPFVKAPLNTGCPVVNTVHDLLFLKLKEYNLRRNVLYHRLFAWRGRRVCRRAAAVLTVSEYSKKDIVHLWGVDPDKIEVVPNVVSNDFGSTTGADQVLAVKREYGITGAYVFYVGNFGPHKNIGRLIRAYSEMPEKLRDRCVLVLAGRKDRYVPELQERAKQLRVGGRVRFTGFVPNKDLGPLYSGASLFAFPSLYEGFGLPPLEAMACGVPVVVSDATSLPEVVGDAGLLVRPRDVFSIRDAIVRVLDEPGLAATLAQRSLSRAGLYSPEQVLPRFLEVLESAAGGGH